MDTKIPKKSSKLCEDFGVFVDCRVKIKYQRCTPLKSISDPREHFEVKV